MSRRWTQPRPTRSARSRLRDFFTWCTGAGLDSPLAARRVHLDGYAETLRELGASPATVSRRLSAVAGLYDYAIDEGLLERSPATRVRRPKLGEHAVSTGLSRDELAALLAAAAHDGPRALVAVLLLGLNGLRVSELCAARVEDLTTERGHRVLRIVRKGGRTARIPLAPRTAAAIDAYVTGRDGGPLLLTKTGRGMDRHAVWRLLRRLAHTAVPHKASSIHPEVKSGGYVQAWAQRAPSKVVFSGLRSRTWSPETSYALASSYNADVYVFAVATALTHHDYDVFNAHVVPRERDARSALEELRSGKLHADGLRWNA